MAEATDKKADLIKQFRGLKTHAEKCAFFHQPDNYPVLGAIYNPVHFPKPEEKATDKPATE